MRFRRKGGRGVWQKFGWYGELRERRMLLRHTTYVLIVNSCIVRK